MTIDDERTLLLLLIEDLNESPADRTDRIAKIVELANKLGYGTIATAAQMFDKFSYLNTNIISGDFEDGGFQTPPFTVGREKSKASKELKDEVDNLAKQPGKRLK